MSKSKKPRQKRYYINDEIYQSDILVFTGGTCDEAVDYIRNKYDIETAPRLSPTEFVNARVMSNPGFKGCALWFKRPKPPASLVAHEVLHIAHHILGGSGLTLTDESEEAYAYYIDWLTKKIGNKVW